MRAVNAIDSKRREQAERIEVAVVVGRQDEAALGGEMLPALHPEPVEHAQPAADEHRGQEARGVGDHLGVARKLPEPTDRRPLETGSGLVAPPRNTVGRPARSTGQNVGHHHTIPLKGPRSPSDPQSHDATTVPLALTAAEGELGPPGTPPLRRGRTGRVHPVSPAARAAITSRAGNARSAGRRVRRRSGCRSGRARRRAPG